MVSGSIYIDPDGVSSVSSQMLRTADELDALRRSIVPKVYDVITMSYPLVNELPDTGYSLGSAQDSIGSFDYRASVLAEQIRTAGYVLNQVADEGRVMMQELLHQATTFTFPGGTGSGMTSRSTGSGSILNTLGGAWNIASSIVCSILQSDAFKKTNEVLGSTLPILQDFLKSIAKSGSSEAKSLEGLGPASLLFAGAGVIFDIASGGDYSPRTIAGDLTGGGIALGVSLIPVVGEVVDAITIVSAIDHLEATGLSVTQNWYAQAFTGDVKQQLLDSSENWQIVADNANTGKVFDGLGLTVVDVATGIATGNFSQVPSDLENTAASGGRLALSFVQTEVNTDTTIINDTLAVGDKVVQVLPLPEGVKNFTNSATGDALKVVNGVADFVTRPDDIKKAWNWATGWL